MGSAQRTQITKGGGNYEQMAFASHGPSLSLRAWSSDGPKSDSIPFLISRINAQRGSFRNITEAGLAQEAEAVDARSSVEEEREADVSEPDSLDIKTQTEDIFKAKGEILQAIGQATTEAAYSLDFVSLLLSQHTPRQAESTISAVLKQNVPLGSLGAERNQAVQASAAKKKDEGLTALGWKLQSLSNTADSLLSSASRLESEMEKETKYWEQILSVKEQGWSLSRLPREKHTLGVRYGFAEASREFSDRGLAALRRQDDGNINLDLGIRASSNTLRVRLERKGEIVASSSIHREASMDNLEPLTRAILQARNDIFDEELFHEIYREARTLTNRGVRCNSDTINIPLESGKRILIDVVPIEPATDEPRSGSGKDWAFVDVLVNTLRILLSHAHRQTLRRRSQPPPPLTEKPPQRPSYFMLRPVIDYLHHRPASLQVSDFLGSLEVVIEKAKLILLVDDSGVRSGLSNAFDQLLQKPTQVAEALVELLSRAMFHTYKLTLPFGTRITLHVRTSTMGVEYRIIEESDATSSIKRPKENFFQSFEAAKRHLQLLVKLELLSLVQASPGGEAWHATSPFSGELNLDRGFKHQAQILLLDLTDEGLSMTWNGRDNAKEKDGKYKWANDESPAIGESRGIVELARSIAEGFVVEL